MPQRHLSSTSMRARVVVILAAAALLMTGLAVSADAAVGPDSFEVTGDWTDMNSGAREWSGATYNPVRNVLLTVDDETNAYEFQITDDGAIDRNAPVRVLDLSPVGNSDWEGVAWVNDDTYAFLSEASGTAFFYDVSPNRDTILPSDLLWSFDAGGPQGNTGTEGIAVGADGSFYVTDEWPSTVSKFNASGALESTVDLTDTLWDATGVVAAADDTLIVTSHESRVAVQIDVDWVAGTYAVLGTIDLSSFEQLEGVALIGNDTLHFFGEAKGGQTYSQWSAEVVALTADRAAFSAGDVDCSGGSDLADAILITRIAVGAQQLDPGCGTGDINLDGTLNVGDALVIVQCTVGADNTMCAPQS